MYFEETTIVTDLLYKRLGAYLGSIITLFIKLLFIYNNVFLKSAWRVENKLALKMYEMKAVFNEVESCDEKSKGDFSIILAHSFYINMQLHYMYVC